MNLVEHIKDINGRHICTVAAVAVDKIGVAIRNPNEKSNRKVATEVAVGRAMYGTSPARIADRWVCLGKNKYFYTVQEIVTDAVGRMSVRAKKYFKS